MNQPLFTSKSLRTMQNRTLFTVLFIFSLFVTTVIQAQSPVNPISSNSTTEQLNFEACGEISIHILDQSLTSTNSIDIANWEDAFSLEDIEPNFFDLDNKRFYIQLESSSNLGSFINVLLETLDENGNVVDQQTDVKLKKISGGFSTKKYRSTARIVVVDNDVIDDNFSDYTGSDQDIDVYDGDDDIGTNDDNKNDPTIYGILGQRIRVTYFSNGRNEPVTSELIDICEPSNIKRVRLNLINMRNNAGTGTYLQASDILAEIDKMQKAWGQCCIRFVNKDGNHFTEADVVSTTQPAALSLDNGLHMLNQVPNLSTIALSQQEQTHLQLKDNDPSTVDMFFVNKYVLIDNESDTTPTDTNVAATAFIDWLAPSSHNPNITAAQVRTIIITTNARYFTYAHEIGHILTDRAHFVAPTELGGDLDYNGSAEGHSDFPVRANLMRYPPTSAMNGVKESKRLLPFQCFYARNETDLPY